VLTQRSPGARCIRPLLHMQQRPPAARQQLGYQSINQFITHKAAQ